MRGVYKLFFNDRPNKVYVGSANNVNGRYESHLYYLQRNKHHNKELQADFNASSVNLCYTYELCDNIDEVEIQRIVEHRKLFGENSTYNKSMIKRSCRSLDLYCVEFKKYFRSSDDAVRMLNKLGVSPRVFSPMTSFSKSAYSLTWKPYNGQEVTNTYDYNELLKYSIRQYIGKNKMFYLQSDDMLFKGTTNLAAFIMSKYSEKGITCHTYRNRFADVYGIVELSVDDLLSDRYINLLPFNPIQKVKEYNLC